jgi:hypothetical protein
MDCAMPLIHVSVAVLLVKIARVRVLLRRLALSYEK